jgi:chromosome condensin MukBEF ATPase and DNA-binding subunit MukB
VSNCQIIEVSNCRSVEVSKCRSVKVSDGQFICLNLSVSEPEGLEVGAEVNVEVGVALEKYKNNFQQQKVQKQKAKTLRWATSRLHPCTEQR